MAAPNMDLKRLLGEPSFPFLIGPNQTKFYLSPGVLAETAPRLFKMTQPGWKEHEDGFAVLADIEPETFALFAEYAYSRNYVVDVERQQGQMTDFDKPYHGLFFFYCRNCGEEDVDGPTAEGARFPFCSQKCRDQYGRQTSASCAECCESFDGMPNKIPALCPECSHRRQSQYTGEKGSIQDIDAGRPFCNLWYWPFSNNDPTPGVGLVTRSPVPIPDLALHAKVHVFADYNMIPDLQYLSLLRLHRALVIFPLFEATVGKFVELVNFVYANTASTQNDRDEEGELTLRALVTMYAVGMARELSEMEKFRTMLAEGSDCVADFIKGVSKRIT